MSDYIELEDVQLIEKIIRENDGELTKEELWEKLKNDRNKIRR